ncbi:MAG: methyltransferase domain-containing protein [Clostridiales bacterium]|nr:methyltransferase domain-containing protein [Clostridiales bacterium]
MAVRKILDSNGALSRSERAFIKRAAEGTIERQIELDYIAEQFSTIKVPKMKPVIRSIVRSGIYQLKYMDSVPDAVVVNEAVKLAGKRGLSGLAGFVNGLLRAVAAGVDEVIWPDERTEPVTYLSVKYSMPEWIVERFIADYGRDRTESILASYQGDSGTWVRVDTRRVTPEEISKSLEEQGVVIKNNFKDTAEDNTKISSDDQLLLNGKEKKPHLPYALLLENIDRLGDLPEFKEGLIYPQNISSMMVAEIANPRDGDRVLDICAAPGGKAIHMAQKADCHVIACDISEAKASLIRENVARCRTPGVKVRIHDALDFDPALAEAFDIVLADLPCSGLGVMGDKTDIRYRSSPERITSLAALQRDILAVASRYVKPGGTLIYSTCTMTREENQDNTAWLTDAHSAFTLEYEKILLPDEGCDGFYIAKLQRRERKK